LNRKQPMLWQATDAAADNGQYAQSHERLA
jgi:hypothetical protein